MQDRRHARFARRSVASGDWQTGRSAVQKDSADREVRRTENLLPAGQGALYRERFSVADYFDGDFVAGLLAAEGVGEVVEVRDRLAVELHHDVTLLQAGFRGGGILADVGEFHAVDA